MYDLSIMAKWDYENAIAYAEDMGMEKGERKRALEMACEMKKDGEPLTKILKYTRLSAYEIEKL